MRFQVSGKQIDLGDALPDHVEKSIDSVIKKYAERPTDAHIVFSREAHEFICEVTVHLSTGLKAFSKAHASDIYAAFETSADKMEKQLRRYKRRLKDHHKSREEPIELMIAPSYVLSRDQEEGEEPKDLQPLIIAEMEAKIPSLSVGEAVMQMELEAAPFLIFRNEKHTGLNIVYHRDDGNIGWIDPELPESK